MDNHNHLISSPCIIECSYWRTSETNASPLQPGCIPEICGCTTKSESDLESYFSDEYRSLVQKKFKKISIDEYIRAELRGLPFSGINQFFVTFIDEKEGVRRYSVEYTLRSASRLEKAIVAICTKALQEGTSEKIETEYHHMGSYRFL